MNDEHQSARAKVASLPLLPLTDSVEGACDGVRKLVGVVHEVMVSHLESMLDLLNVALHVAVSLRDPARHIRGMATKIVPGAVMAAGSTLLVAGHERDDGAIRGASARLKTIVAGGTPR